MYFFTANNGGATIYSTSNLQMFLRSLRTGFRPVSRCFQIDVPNFGQERWYFLVLQFQTEAHLGVLVAQSAQLRQYAQQFGEYRAVFDFSPVIHVSS